MAGAPEAEHLRSLLRQREDQLAFLQGSIGELEATRDRYVGDLSCNQDRQSEWVGWIYFEHGWGGGSYRVKHTFG